jgi:hypothetical protein
MDMKHSILSYLGAAESELQTQRNLLSYDLVVMRDICEFGLKGNTHDLFIHRVGHVANQIIERQARMAELHHKIAQFKEMLEEVEND